MTQDAFVLALTNTTDLRAVRELEPAAAADLLGIPPGTVRSRLHLARKQLLRALSSRTAVGR